MANPIAPMRHTTVDGHATQPQASGHADNSNETYFMEPRELIKEHRAQLARTA